MNTSRSESYEGQLPACGPTARDPQLEEKLYDTFVKMRNLLEEYAPSWYPDTLRERADEIVQHTEQASNGACRMENQSPKTSLTHSAKKELGGSAGNRAAPVLVWMLCIGMLMAAIAVMLGSAR